VDSKDALQRALNDKRGGDILNLTVYRGGRNVVVHVKLAKRPSNSDGRRPAKDTG